MKKIPQNSDFLAGKASGGGINQFTPIKKPEPEYGQTRRGLKVSPLTPLPNHSPSEKINRFPSHWNYFEEKTITPINLPEVPSDSDEDIAKELADISLQNRGRCPGSYREDQLSATPKPIKARNKHACNRSRRTKPQRLNSYPGSIKLPATTLVQPLSTPTTEAFSFGASTGPDAFPLAEINPVNIGWLSQSEPCGFHSLPYDFAPKTVVPEKQKTPSPTDHSEAGAITPAGRDQLADL